MRHRAICAVALSASLGHVLAAEVSSAAWTQPQALIQLASHRDRASVNSIYSNETAWSYIVEHIATGDTSWIRVAKALHPLSDGGMSEELRDAMFQALRANPDAVLSSAEPEFELSVLCGGRSDPLSTFEAAEAEQDATIRAVERVNTRALASRKNECLTHLRKGRAHIKRFFSK